MKRSFGAIVLTSLLAAPTAAQIIVDHPPHPAGGPASDTEFVDMFERPFWQIEADDFQLLAPATARRLVWFGFYDRDNPPIVEAMQIRLYAKRPGDGLPGGVLYEEVVSDHTRTATGRRIGVGISPHEYRYEMNLAAPISLSDATPYWISIVQLGDSSTAWRWELALAELNGHTFQNPNYLDWEDIGPNMPDLAFRLMVPEPGMLLLVCLGLWGAYAGRRAR